MTTALCIERSRIGDVCQRWSITELALFGSVLLPRQARQVGTLTSTVASSMMSSCARLSPSTPTSPIGFSAWARRTGKSLKSVVNEALRIGLGLAEKPVGHSRFRIRAFVDGLQPSIDPEKMNQMADEIEADELAQKHAG